MTTSSQDPMYSNLFELNNLTPNDHSHQQALDKIKLTSDRCDRGAKLSTAAHYQYGSIDSNNRWGAGGDQTKQLDETVKARRINLKHGDIKLISIQHRIKYWAFWWLTISLALIWAQLPAELPILSLDAASAPAPAPFITLSPELLDANQPLYQQQQQQQVLGGAKSKRAAVDRQQQQQNNNNVEYQEIKPALGDYDKRYDGIDDAINFEANGASSSSVDDDDDLILATDNNLDSELRRRQEINSRYLNEALVSRRKKRQLVQGQESGDKSSLRFNNGSQVNLDDFISVDDLREVIADELKHWLEEQRLRLMDGTRRKLAEKAKQSAIAKMTSSSSSGKNSLESKPAAWLNAQLIQSDNNDDLTRAQQEEENLSSEATKRYVDNLARKKLYEDNTEHYSEDSQFDKSYDEPVIAGGASTGLTGSSNKQNSGGGGGGREAVELLLLDNDNNNKEFELEMGPEEDAMPEGRLIEERLDEFMPMNDNGNDDTSITSGLDSSIDSTDTADLGNAAQQLWIQRRRLNRDRALEPPAGQRQQPMRRRDADLWQPTTSEAGYFDNNNNQQQQITGASEAQPPTVFINGLSLDQHASDKTHQQREEDLFLLETMANKLGRNWPISEEKRHDLGVEMGTVGTPFGEQSRRNSDDLQQVNQYNSEAAATIVNPIIITRPKQEIADEYQQLSSSVEQLAGLDGSLGSSEYRARADVGSINDEAATKRQLQQQLDNSLEDIDSADMARIRTTSFPPRKRSMITLYPLVNDGKKQQQPITDEDGPTIRYDTPTNNNDAAMIPMYVNYVNEPSYYEATSDTTTNNNRNRNKNMERNGNDAATTNWRNPMLDLMSYVGARLTSPRPAPAAHLKSQLDGQQQSKWRRSYQLPATFAVDKIHQYRLAPMLSQQLQYQKNPIDERVTSAANLLEQLEPSNYNPFVSAMASMSSDNNRPTDDRLLFQQQQQQQQIRNAMSEYQRYLEGLNDESEQRRRMSDLLEVDLDLPRGTIMDIGLIHRQSMVVKINPIYLSDAKISELTSKYGNILAVVDADGRDVAIMTISRSDLLSSDAMRLANYNMASLGGGGGGGGNHQVHPSIMQPFRLLTHSGDNNKQAAALLEAAAAANKQKEQQTTFNDKLGLSLLILVVVLAMLPTLLLIRYTMGRHRTYAADMGVSVEDNAHDKNATKASSLFGASNGDYGRHTCCRLRAKCSNFCSYARSAYVGLQGKAYKNLPDENNELTGVDDLATMSGTCKGDASIIDNNQQSCAKCSSPTKDAAPIGHLDTRRSSSNSSTKSLITGTSQSATINGHQWGNNGADDEPIVTSNMDIIAAHMILSYMEEHLRDKNRLKRDWRELCSYEADLNSTNCALMSENRLKNRNQNAIAYDHSRVKLATTTTTTQSGCLPSSSSAILTPPGLLKQAELTQQTKYINASYIYDDDPKRATHIITQAPLKETVADFWQMVWEQGCSVIVMLTRLSENGHSLCHCYWPMESRNHQVYGDFEVHLVSEHICCQDYLVRNIYLIDRRSLETRTITQFHYLSWPDKLIPSSINKFLEFRRKVNKCYRISSRPIVVHCNDGAGRSGTYTLIDMVLNRISKGAKEIDIAATLEHLRDQRMGMVNNEIQFEFVLAAVAEEIQAILKALPQ